MLSPLDDYPVHQIPDVLDHVATSDRNFYDRYYFNCHTRDGSVFLVLAMACYPNLGLMDAFATAVLDGKQHIVRASRELEGDRHRTCVGPLAVEVIEGLRRLRLTCAPNEWGLAYDLTFEATYPAYQEPRFFRRAGSRVVMDYLRYTQVGRWTGTLTVAGRSFDVTPESWCGSRDRSWGVRSVGDPEPPSANTARGLRSFFWQWAPMQFDDHVILYAVTEEADGRRWHEFCVRVRPEGPAEPLAIVRHELKLRPGSRIFAGGRLVLADPSGKPLEIEMRPLSTMHMSGAGYLNFSSNWRHGHYHGVPLAVDGETWDLGDANLRLKAGDHTETVCEFGMGGKTGHGLIEFYCLGPYEPHGFKTAADVAP